jgi:hypothetical protein
MAGETVEALSMITIFGLFEALLNVPRIQRLRHSLHAAAGEFWQSFAMPPRPFQPVKVRAKRPPPR